MKSLKEQTKAKLLLLGYEHGGYTVQLLQNSDGGYEVVYSQRGQPKKSAGLFLKQHLLQALNKYHSHRDMAALAVAA